MPIESFLNASGIRIKRGMKGLVYDGTGQIYFSKAPKIGIDSNLWACLKIAVDQTGLAVEVSSVDTGRHVPGSRHYQGRAADIHVVIRVGNKLVGTNANLANAEASKFYHYLLDHGFHVGEGRAWPAVIWGPPHTHTNPTGIPHDSHLHVSLPRRRDKG